MREILFRGKRLDNGEWVEGSLWTWGKKIRIHQIFDILDSALWFRVDPNTVGQYTGLCDKNGKKIFEGDIIKVVWQADGRTPVDDCYVAEFRNGYFAARKHNGKNVVGSIANFTNHKAIGNTGVFVEIIGNIHDNPDLMKGE